VSTQGIQPSIHNLAQYRVGEGGPGDRPYIRCEIESGPIARQKGEKRLAFQHKKDRQQRIEIQSPLVVREKGEKNARSDWEKSSSGRKGAKPCLISGSQKEGQNRNPH